MMDFVLRILAIITTVYVLFKVWAILVSNPNRSGGNFALTLIFWVAIIAIVLRFLGIEL